MADGPPKDYCSMYREGTRNTMYQRSNDTNNSLANYKNSMNSATTRPPVPSARGGQANKSLDGSFVPLKHREQSIDLKQVVAKLEDFTKTIQPNHRFFAMDTLNKHYTSVFRRKPDQLQQPSDYRVYIQYFNEKQLYVVKVSGNYLREVRAKMPIPGSYRYFFKQLDSAYEEVELDDSLVPYHEKDGSRQIYCQVFPL